MKKLKKLMGLLMAAMMLLVNLSLTAFAEWNGTKTVLLPCEGEAVSQREKTADSAVYIKESDILDGESPGVIAEKPTGSAVLPLRCTSPWEEYYCFKSWEPRTVCSERETPCRRLTELPYKRIRGEPFTVKDG